MGNHKLCKRYSFICKGGDNHWIEKSAVLPQDFVLLGTSDKVTETKLL